MTCDQCSKDFDHLYHCNYSKWMCCDCIYSSQQQAHVANGAESKRLVEILESLQGNFKSGIKYERYTTNGLLSTRVVTHL